MGLVGFHVYVVCLFVFVGLFVGGGDFGCFCRVLGGNACLFWGFRVVDWVWWYVGFCVWVFLFVVLVCWWLWVLSVCMSELGCLFCCEFVFGLVLVWG